MHDVKMPDGTIIKNVPEGTTRAQLMARVGKVAPRAKGSGFPMLDYVVNAANEAIIGVPQGIYNAASAVTDPIVKGVVNFFGGDGAGALERARRERVRAVDAISRTLVSKPNQVARMGGQIAGAALIPLPKVAAAGKVIDGAKRAVQGAIGGAAVRTPDEDAGALAGIGAAANVLLPPALSALVKVPGVRQIGSMIGRAAAPIVNAADDASEAVMAKVNPWIGIESVPLRRAAPPNVPTSLDGLGRKAAARAARFASVGVDNPTTGMVTRDPRAWRFEREAAKQVGTGDDLVGQFQSVEKSLIDTGKRLSGVHGGAKGAEETGVAVQGALDARRSEMQAATGRLYRQVRDTRGDVEVGRLGGFREALGDQDLADNPAFDALQAGVLRRLERVGMVGPGGKFKDGGNATVSQVEGIRKLVGSLGDGRDPFTRMVRGKLIDALDDDVVAAVGDDAFKTARASARARFEEFSKTFAGRIADEGVAPEALSRKILSDTVRISDLRSLTGSLNAGGEGGQNALSALRAQAVDDLMRGATNADGGLNGGALYRSFEKAAPKLRTLLPPADYKMLRRLASSSRDATADVPFSGVNYSNTTSTLFNGPATKAPGLLKPIAKHGAAMATLGPAGNIALFAAEQAASGRAGSKAAEALLRQIRLAKNPAEASAAMVEMKKASKSNEAVAEALKRLKTFAGNNPAFGGAAAAAASQ